MNYEMKMKKRINEFKVIKGTIFYKCRKIKE